MSEHTTQTEKLTAVEAVAMALAYSDQTESKLGDAIPQSVWTRLYERKLIKLCRDAFDEHFTMTTDEGEAALRSHILLVADHAA